MITRARLMLLCTALALNACPPATKPDSGSAAGGGEATGGSTGADAGATGGAGGGVPGGGGGTTDGGGSSGFDAGPLIEVTQTMGPIEPVDGGLEMEVNRNFDCHTERVEAEAWLQDVEGAPGEALVIRPAGQPCSFQLVHLAGSVGSPLSTQPTGYLVAAARRFADGVRVICASELRSSQVGTSSITRQVDDVSIRCWASATTSFQTTVLAVTAGADWAAWVRSLEPSTMQSGVYFLTWARDFTFQFLNMGERGRPPSDGLYQTVLTWNGTSLVAGAAAQASPLSNPFSVTPIESWTPTADEVTRFSPYFEFEPDGGADGGP